MTNIAVNVTSAPQIYTTFSEYVVAGYWADGYIVSYDSPYDVAGDAFVEVSGVSVVCAVGNVNNNVSVLATGVQATALVHSVNVWNIINDTQLSGWSDITNNESIWVLINDAQTPMWSVPIDNAEPLWANIGQAQSANWSQLG